MESATSKDELILSGVLGLLALLMAFSFSMALGRLEVRRDLMLRETSAIGNLALMADATSAAHALDIQVALSRYAQARLVAVDQSEGAARQVASRNAARLRQPLYLAVREAILMETGKPAAIGLAGAYDQVEDSAVRRDAMADVHLPNIVLWLLCIFSVVSATMIGHSISRNRTHHRAAPATLYVLLSLAFGVMLDLDHPRSGTIVIAQDPFARVVGSLAASKATRPDQRLPTKPDVHRK
ncbi:hypothetical protein PX699_29860 [Sphingobium sp. H39-3-25]|uniref:hypothetical protein n=1 Tax=Sphingobium arseniciresistens TaxID=3030834 RepID=UPI0023B97C5C|nr:hypothetical protein [Sphingobium arseniciresistens]